jgi:uncharacterized repeat protein (TIGR02543 family)
MVKEQKKSIGKSLLIAFVLLLAWFLIIKAGTAFASKNLFEITDAEVSTKSPYVEISNFNFEKGKVSSNVVFHKLGDSVTYKLRLKNTDEKAYVIKSIKDVNRNSYISYKYPNYAGKKVNANEELIFEITQRYSLENTDITNREQSFSASIVFELEDDNGNTNETVIPINEDEENIPAPVFPITGGEDNTYHVTNENSVVKVNPKTNDNIALYIIIFVSASILLFAATRKRIILGNDNLDPARYTGTRKGLKRFKIVSFFLIIGAAIFPAIGRAMQNNDIEFKGVVTFKDKLIITYTVNGEKFEKVVSFESKLELEDPEVPGYKFERWEDKDGNEFDAETPITSDIELTAIFNPIEYTISYELNNGIVDSENQTTYTIESEDITLTNPTRNGYKFTGWTGTGLEDKTENVTIAQGSTENREYEANWEIEEYTITYDLAGGNLGEQTNPETYTIESEDITLNNPTREGYTFAGWTGTDLTEATKDVTITKGTTKNKTYTANWTANEYTITYDLAGGNLGEQTNPGTYTIESEDITLNNPTREGYTFAGWTGTDLTEATQDVTIAKGSKENRIYTATWTADEYTITYNLNGGTAENTTTYTIESENITLNKPTRDGYTFTGWTGTGLENNTETVTINKGSTGNKEYTANWTVKEYTIVYNLNNGTAENASTYTIESEDITLNNPTREGYTFAGWTGTGLDVVTENVTITKGSTGNKEYTANWTANTYEIVFNSNAGTGSMENETMTYDVSKTLTANAFTYEDHVFTGWNTQADGNGTSYEDKASVNNLVTEGTITLYAQWKELAEYTVTFDATEGGTLENNTRVVKEGKKVGELPTPTSNREDYRFKGWYTDKTYTTKVTADTVITGETTFYAQYKYYMSTVFSHTAEVKFNGQGVNLESTDTRFTNSDYINTGIALFSEANFDKDFEISFEIVNFDMVESVSQATLLAAKYEKESLNYPGFVFRRYNSDKKKVEMGARVGASGNGFSKQLDISTVQKVKITRKNGKIYYSINDESLALVCDTQQLTDRGIRFDTPVAFGAALTETNRTMRHAKATLKNISIKLED